MKFVKLFNLWKVPFVIPVFTHPNFFQHLKHKRWTNFITNFYFKLIKFLSNFKIICKYFSVKTSGIFPNNFLQPVNGSKNSIWKWVTKLLSHKTLHETLKFQEKLLPLQTNDVKGMLPGFCSQKECRKCNFQQSEDLNFENFPFGTNHGSASQR